MFFSKRKLKACKCEKCLNSAKVSSFQLTIFYRWEYNHVIKQRMKVDKTMAKKQYSVEELLEFAYKYNKIPSVLFAKDTECRYIYTSEIEDAINGGEEHSIIGKTDMDVQYDPELGKLYYEQDKEILKSGEAVHCYSEFYVNGKKETREIAKSPIYSNGEIIGVCGVVSDVTELMNLKERFEKLSVLDYSTGCYNRNYFVHHDYNSPEHLPCAYIMCDCNDLKLVNDTCGHETGDQYIQLVADVLKFVVDKKGICIRWGGDEFLLVLPNCDETACQQILEQIETEQALKRKILPQMDVAIGYCIRSDMRQSEDEVIQLADQAMYRDKARRKAGRDGDQ